MSVSLISLEARALSNHRSIFFSHTYQHCVSHKSGNKSLTLKPKVLSTSFLSTCDTHTAPLLTRIECTTQSKSNIIFIHITCYMTALLYKKFVDSYGQFNYQFRLFITFSASSSPNMYASRAAFVRI